MLVVSEFTEIRWANALYDPGLIIAFIPMIAVAGGRWWPFLLALPITAVPIAGQDHSRVWCTKITRIGLVPGWLLYGVLPLALTTLAAIWFARQLDEWTPVT